MQAMGALPGAATLDAWWLDPTTVRFQGMATPNGAETHAWFEWGTTPELGTLTPAQAVGNGSALTMASSVLPGAEAQNAYWYRLVASNQIGVAFGAVRIACAGKRVTAWGQTDAGVTTIPPGLSNVVMLAGGAEHALVLRNDGTLAAWGANTYGQTSIPQGLSNVAAIACGSSFNVALRRDRSLVAWGVSDSGQTNTPALTNAVAVSAGLNYGLALTTEGRVSGWGTTFYGETNFPPGLTNIVEISAGPTHALALRADGAVLAWGLNDYGQATVPAGVSNIVSVAAGSGFSAVLKRDGTVFAWGLNGSGQTSIPPGLSNALTLSCGSAHALALKADGTLAVWGHNFYGQTNLPPDLVRVVSARAAYSFSLASTLNRPPIAQPLRVVGLANLDLQIRLPAEDPDGDPLACWIQTLPATGSLHQWSPSGRGAVINAPNTPVTDPNRRVIYTPPLDAVGTGHATFAFGIGDGTLESAAAVIIDLRAPRPDVMTHPATWPNPGAAMLRGMAAPNGEATTAWFEWGTNGSYGHVTPSTAIGSGTAVIPINHPLAGLAAQRPYWCRLVASNRWGISQGPARLVCAAKNAWNWTLNPLAPAPVPSGLSNLVAITAGGNHTLALRDDGTVIAWGENGYGQTNVPPQLGGVVAVTAGIHFSAALKSDGTIAAWGGMGIGETNVPPGLTNVVLITAGLYHTLALKQDGTVVSWGNNSYGNTNVPPGLSNVVDIAAGSWHSAALRADGSIVAWGSNFGGETNPPAGLPRASHIGAGAGFTAVLHDDGVLTAWGDNSGGQTNVPSELNDVVRFSAASFHGLAIDRNLCLTPWGSESGGPPMVLPPGWTNVVEADAGIYRDAALTVNRNPTALNQHASGAVNQDLVIHLSGSDPDGDPLSYRIATLPGRGTLYQFSNGVRGPAINAPGVPLTDPNGRVLYAPPPGAHGEDFTSFDFVASDGGLDSTTPATVQVDITVPKPFVMTQNAAWHAGSMALLRGAVMPNELPTLAWLEWGVDPSLGNQTGVTNLPPSTGLCAVTAPVSGLGLQTGFWFRVVASNQWGVVAGAPARLAAAKSVVAWGGSWQQTNSLPALSNVVFASAGNDQVLALRPDGNLVALGTHNLVSASPPTPITNAISAAGGAWHSMALGRDGRVTAWGQNTMGAIQVPTNLDNVVAVAAGNFHNLALRENGTVTAWGAHGDFVPSGLTNAVAVACGFNHSLALTCDGRVMAWGPNENGQTNVPPGLDRVVAIAARGDHCMALRSNGTVVVWGRYDFGQTNVPTGLNDVLAIASGGQQCIALNESGALQVWGQEYPGQTNVLAGLSNVVAVAGGPSIGLALTLNRGPVAHAAGFTSWANQDVMITLAGADPERDALAFRVRTLPATGNLYQCVAGAKGDAILAPDTLVTDPAGRVFFAPVPDEFGSPYATFTFTARDGEYESAPAQVGIHLLAEVAQAGTQSAVWLSPSNAVLRGMALANGLNTTAWFEWGNNPGYGQATPAVAAGTSPRVSAVTAALQGLVPHQVYWYRLVASNRLGISYGQAQRFCAGKRLTGWGGNNSGQTSVPLGDNLADLSAGRSHGLAVKADGGLLAWGNNYNGQSTPPTGLSNFIQVAAGAYHSLALQSNGAVRTWGYGANGLSSVPLNLTNAIAVAAGYYNSVALREDGTAVSWGGTSYQNPIQLSPHTNLVAIAAGYYHTIGLGIDGRVVRLWDGTLPLTPTNLTDIAAIAAGDNHGLGLRRDGTVAAWGDNSAGQTNVPPGLTNVVAIAANGNHSLALLRNGTAVAWGSNASGEGVVPSSLTNATHIASGENFNLAVVLNRQPTAIPRTVTGTPNQDVLILLSGFDPDGDALAYRVVSLPAAGQLFHVVAGSRGSPITTPLTLLTNTTSVIFAPLTNGFGVPYAVFDYDVHDGQYRSSPAQVRVDLLGQPTAASRRPFPISNTQALLQGSALAKSLPSVAWFDWGPTPAYGQRTESITLGGGAALQQVSTFLAGLTPDRAYYYRLAVSNAAGVAYGAPQALTTGAKATLWGVHASGKLIMPQNLGYLTDLAAGDTHTISLGTDGTVFAWGVGSDDAGRTKTNTPAGLSNAVAVAAGVYHSAALKRDGRVTVWGGATYAFNGLTNVPASLTNAIAIAIGSSHMLALRSNGTVLAWGSSGNPATNTPAGLSNVVAIAAGNSHSLALKADGAVTGWGLTPQATVPPGLSNVVAIAAGAAHSLALKADGRVVAWGETTYGKTSVPTTLSNVIAIAAGIHHSLALQTDGLLVGWGYSGYGLIAAPSTVSNLITIASGGYHNAVLSPNRPPAATPQTVSGPANFGRVITLAGTDADFDALDAVITSLPSAGLLYQYQGGWFEPPITNAGTAVLDPANRIVFVPATNGYGSPYAAFSFAMTDGSALSPPAAVTVTINPMVPPVFTDCGLTNGSGFQLSFSGDPNTVYCVWGSTNLAHWEFLGRADQPQPGRFMFVDPAAPVGGRFYRASTDCGP